MMLMPSIFHDVFDDFFDFSAPAYSGSELMNTDIKETEKGYELAISLPGVKKEDIKAEVKDGYLMITAAANSKTDEKDKTGKYIRRERYSGSMSRSFYVGDGVSQEDIKAKFENGVLTLDVPKKEAKPAVEEKKTIAIEG